MTKLFSIVLISLLVVSCGDSKEEKNTEKDSQYNQHDIKIELIGTWDCVRKELREMIDDKYIVLKVDDTPPFPLNFYYEELPHVEGFTYTEFNEDRSFTQFFKPLCEAEFPEWHLVPWNED